MEFNQSELNEYFDLSLTNSAFFVYNIYDNHRCVFYNLIG